MNSITVSGVIVSKEIDLRKTPENIPVTSFLLKVKREKRKSEVQGDNYDTFTIVCWNEMAVYVVNNFKEDMSVEVRGAVRTSRRKLKDYIVYKNGKEVPNFQIPVFEIYANRVDKV